MNVLVSSILVGSIVVVAFDCVGSLLSQLMGFDYSLLAPGSFLIYIGTGFVASRSSVPVGIIAAAVVGFVDATIGWYLSLLIGPLTTLEELTVPVIMTTVGLVPIMAGILGGAGGLFRSMVKSG